ncbi:MAG: hypothetical protein NT098_04730 [Candidatus Parcubacteria bacterium]|nr:hypothetical protein [Candidatus Parcubacteria bacterium]
MNFIYFIIASSLEVMVIGFIGGIVLSLIERVFVRYTGESAEQERKRTLKNLRFDLCSMIILTPFLFIIKSYPIFIVVSFLLLIGILFWAMYMGIERKFFSPVIFVKMMKSL